MTEQQLPGVDEQASACALCKLALGSCKFLWMSCYNPGEPNFSGSDAYLAYLKGLNDEHRNKNSKPG
jgi:hypothetical protein